MLFYPLICNKQNIFIASAIRYGNKTTCRKRSPSISSIILYINVYMVRLFFSPCRTFRLPLALSGLSSGVRVSFSPCRSMSGFEFVVLRSMSQDFLSLLTKIYRINKNTSPARFRQVKSINNFIFHFFNPHFLIIQY